MGRRWTARDIGRQDGRTVVVTGANSGIGLVAAGELAAAGAHVVLAVRDVERGAAAAATMAGSTEVRHLDLADLASVRAFAAGWSGAIDVLLANAGVMAIPLRRTADGFEMQFGTNHLGHFALANQLLPHVTDRIVTVSSVAHRSGTIDLDDPNWERRRYRSWAAYAQSKLANLLFAFELERRLVAAGSGVRSLAVHPGYTATGLQSHAVDRLSRVAMAVANRLVAQPAAMGALPSLYAVTQDVPGGSYIGPDGFQEARGHPTLVGCSGAASDGPMAAALWTLSEDLTGTAFPTAAAP